MNARHEMTLSHRDFHQALFRKYVRSLRTRPVALRFSRAGTPVYGYRYTWIVNFRFDRIRAVSRFLQQAPRTIFLSDRYPGPRPALPENPLPEHTHGIARHAVRAGNAAPAGIAGDPFVPVQVDRVSAAGGFHQPFTAARAVSRGRAGPAPDARPGSDRTPFIRPGSNKPILMTGTIRENDDSSIPGSRALRGGQGTGRHKTPADQETPGSIATNAPGSAYDGLSFAGPGNGRETRGERGITGRHRQPAAGDSWAVMEGEAAGRPLSETEVRTISDRVIRMIESRIALERERRGFLS